MAVILLIHGVTVATTEQDFEVAGGRGGNALLIRDFDNTQLSGQASNLSYETEESLHVLGSMFGYIVPRVKWLQQGISNTVSKVDAGYNGRLLVTLFNLGRNTIEFPRWERFCSLVVHSVFDGVQLYEGGAKRLLGPDRSRSRNVWERIRDVLEASPATVHALLIVATPALAVVEFVHLFFNK